MARFKTLCVFSMLLAPSWASAQHHPLWGDLQPGPHKVGFKVVETYDYTRAFKAKTSFRGNPADGETARPMSIYLWYPAQPGNAGTMHFADYVDLATPRLDFEGPRTAAVAASRAKFRARLERALRTEVSDDLVRRIYTRETGAVRDAPAVPESFPPVLFMGSAPTSNSLLGEYLASHGYLVAGLQLKGVMSRAFTEFTPNPISLDTHMADMAFLRTFLEHYPGADASRLGVVSFSSNTLGNLLFQMRDMSLDALVSLEGHEGFLAGIELLQTSPYYDPVKIRVPYVRIGKASEEASPRYASTSEFFDAIKYAERYWVSFRDADHFSFLSEEIAIGNTTEEKRRVYEAAARYILAAFDVHLKQDPDRRAALRGPAVPSDSSLMTVQFQAALPAAPSEQEFYRILEEENGIQQAWQIYEEVKKREPGHNIFREHVLSRLARFRTPIEDRIEIHKLVVNAYPRSIEAHHSLASALAQNQDQKEAIRHFEVALTLLEKNAELDTERREMWRDRLQRQLAAAREEAIP